jgi:protein-histidine pros-kinase
MMGILARINLSLTLVFVLAAAVAGYVCRSILEADAQRELLVQAGMLLDSAVAIRSYTANEIGPLLADRLQKEFLPQSVPFYAATQNFLSLHAQFPEYSYKEATLNPTNPRDRAADWEADIIQRFRNDPAEQEVSGIRDTPMGPSLYRARPIRATAECLACHSSPAVAPAAMVARYGDANGFGWQPGEVVGAQVISVPYEQSHGNVEQAWRSFMLLFAALIAAGWLTINAVVYTQVVRPLRRVAALAAVLSLGDESPQEFPRKGAREITGLGAAFERMRRSLAKAAQLLGSRA